MNEEVREEIDAIQAIYDKDYESKQIPKLAAFTENIIHIFTIRIIPAVSQSEDIYTSLILRISISKSYPNVSPILVYDDVKGLTEKEENELKTLLDTIMKNRLGSTMLHDIISEALYYIGEHNKRPSSLYDGMKEREQREKEVLLQLKKGNTEDQIITESNTQIQEKLVLELPSNLPVNDKNMKKDADTTRNWLKEFINQGDDDDIDNDVDNDSDTENETKMNIWNKSRSRYDQEFVEISLLGS